MTAVFSIVVGLVVAFLAVRWMVKYLLMIFSKAVIERKFTTKVIVWLVNGYEERAIVALGIMGWIVVVAAVGVAITPFAVVAYFAYLSA